LQARQKRRRRAQIKNHIIESTTSLEDIGLEAVSMQLKTSNGNTVNIPLKDPDTATCNDEANKLEVFSYLTMKHHISQEGYHELSMQFPELPHSHTVCHVIY